LREKKAYLSGKWGTVKELYERKKPDDSKLPFNENQLRGQGKLGTGENPKLIRSVRERAFRLGTSLAVRGAAGGKWQPFFLGERQQTGTENDKEGEKQSKTS